MTPNLTLLEKWVETSLFPSIERNRAAHHWRLEALGVSHWNLSIPTPYATSPKK